MMTFSLSIIQKEIITEMECCCSKASVDQYGFYVGQRPQRRRHGSVGKVPG